MLYLKFDAFERITYKTRQFCFLNPIPHLQNSNESVVTNYTLYHKVLIHAPCHHGDIKGGSREAMAHLEFRVQIL